MANSFSLRVARHTAPHSVLGKQRHAVHGIDIAQIHWPRTLQEKRQRALTREHLRFKNKISRCGILHLFVVDCSGSMLRGEQLARAQGALLHLHQRAYQQRADIALISYAGDEAVVHIQPTAARPFNAQELPDALTSLQAGGGTPFARGIATADALLANNRRRNPTQQCWLWLLSDGRSTEMPERPAFADTVVVIDCEQQRIALNRCRTLAENWQANYQTLDALILS